MRLLVVFVSLAFTLKAQANVYTKCVTALKSKFVDIDQEMANDLSGAITEGNTKRIKKLAPLWLQNKDNSFRLSYPLWMLEKGFDTKSDDLLLFAANIATAWHEFSGDARISYIDNLKTLVKMGFHVSTESEQNHVGWSSMFYWSNFGLLGSVNETQRQVLDILMDAGLSAEKLHLMRNTEEDELTTQLLNKYSGESPAHQSLLFGDDDKFKTIINSGLITKDNINLKVNARGASNYVQIRFNHDYIVKATLLHWSAMSNDDGMRTQLLISKGADPNVHFEVIDIESATKIEPTWDLEISIDYGNELKNLHLLTTPLETAYNAGNYAAIVHLLYAKADRTNFDINSKTFSDGAYTLLHNALYKEVIQSHETNLLPIMSLIRLGASPFIKNEHGDTVIDNIENIIKTTSDEIDNLQIKHGELKKTNNAEQTRINRDIANESKDVYHDIFYNGTVTVSVIDDDEFDEGSSINVEMQKLENSIATLNQKLDKYQALKELILKEVGEYETRNGKEISTEQYPALQILDDGSSS